MRMHFVSKFHKYVILTINDNILVLSKYHNYISIHISVTRISKGRTCRVEILSDRASIEGGDRSR